MQLYWWPDKITLKKKYFWCYCRCGFGTINQCEALKKRWNKNSQDQEKNIIYHFVIFVVVIFFSLNTLLLVNMYNLFYISYWCFCCWRCFPIHSSTFRYELISITFMLIHFCIYLVIQYVYMYMYIDLFISYNFFVNNIFEKLISVLLLVVYLWFFCLFVYNILGKSLCFIFYFHF